MRAVESACVGLKWRGLPFASGVANVMFWLTGESLKCDVFMNVLVWVDGCVTGQNSLCISCSL